MLIDLFNRRFEELTRYSKRWFEYMRCYVDKRVGLVEKLSIGFNIPILTGMIILLIRLFTG